MTLSQSPSAGRRKSSFVTLRPSTENTAHTAATISLEGVAEPSTVEAEPIIEAAPLEVVAPFAEVYRASFANGHALNLKPTAKVSALLIVPLTSDL